MAPLGVGLRHRTDISAARWVADSAVLWSTVASLGPPGFEAYVRLPTVIGRSEHEVIADLRPLLAASTSRSDDVTCALWDGWGDLYDGREIERAFDFEARLARPFRSKPPAARPAFAPDVLEGPRLHLGERSYLLFGGPLAEAGEWGARPVAAGWPRRTISAPNLMWPADRAWCVALDPENDWCGVGGDQSLIDAILADPSRAARRATYGPHPAAWSV